jgi:predicted signal transduction protein with EAL and GGDEF domain
MEHGKYHAWIHVVLAFALQIIVLAFLFVRTTEAMVHSNTWNGFDVGLAILGAFLIYWNRWHCIETYASTYCTGVLNLSIVSVPLITFLYANYRGIRKLRGR